MDRMIDDEIRLIPYYRNDEVSLPWYQDLDVCRQVDNRSEPYDVELLHRMYDYLSAQGACYYIEYKGVLVGMFLCRIVARLRLLCARSIRTCILGDDASWI